MSNSEMFIIFFFLSFFTLFASPASLNGIKKCPEKQSEALLLFKHNLSSITYPNDDNCGSYNHPIMMNWNTNTDCCNWDGVTCDDSTGDVIRLDLSCGRLQGTIYPDSSLLNLTHLIFLRLSANSLNGILPSGLFTSPSLEHLDLSYNMFSGNVPFESFSLPSLKVLYLNNNNQLAGQIDMQTFQQLTNLIYLDLSFNNFSGVWAGEIGGDYRIEYLNLQSNLIEGPFPASICNMSKLQLLDISNNRFGGLIPQCFGNITSSLRMINMGNNRFQGTIPNIYGDCGGLEGLILNGNQIRGEVPISLSKCQSLKVVDFGNNHLNGTFPGWLGALPNLQALVLKSNNFHVHIQPSSTVESPFPSLRVLDLSHNRFVGKLPAKYFQSFNSMKNVVRHSTTPEYLDMGDSIVVTVKGLTHDFPEILIDYKIIDLSNNTFEGQIPYDIGGLNSLIVLNLSHNSLIGPIPHALGNLTEIESFDLSWNQLSGEIPQILADIKTLEVLNLSQNDLVGRIPEGPQFATFEGNSFGGNPRLCGTPLLKNCSEYSHEPQLESDEGLDEESGFTWEVVMLGYGCGTLVGLVMGYLMLSTRKVKWFNAIADATESLVLKKKKRRHVYIMK